jgi:hypothetical protein
MADDSLIEEMRAALRDDFEHARAPRPSAAPPVEPAAEAPVEPEPAEEPVPRRWAWLHRRTRPQG